MDIEPICDDVDHHCPFCGGTGVVPYIEDEGEELALNATVLCGECDGTGLCSECE